jgi:hypothetical protein
LFSYREVPQASTGFSPFELLYGHKVHGPLHLINEIWNSNVANPKSLVDYVLSFKNKIKEYNVFAQENMKKAQIKQKTW